ncbi:hypothetical protein B0F90DRAFT_1734415, partial [Multifurca ochricompacta]
MKLYQSLDPQTPQKPLNAIPQDTLRRFYGHTRRELKSSTCHMTIICNTIWLIFVLLSVFEMSEQ